MQKVSWGIIGCGDVTEVKSGPAFNKVANSALVAVMRRDAEKAKDYAFRHHVPRWYANAADLINDPAVNAVYIATPPSSHAAYALDAMRAGKHVYVEKPMAMHAGEADQLAKAVNEYNVKLVVAHYRRQWPLFKKLKQLLYEKVIGETRLVRLTFYKIPMSKEEQLHEKNAWRLNPTISGGGLFHDSAPHQLDMLLHLFGSAKRVNGIATNQSGQYAAADTVAGTIHFECGMIFSGVWCFAAPANIDYCEITGTSGNIKFSFFNDHFIDVTIDGINERFNFERLAHVQQPMIAATVQYFLNQDSNPCSGVDGAEVMQWIDGFTRPV